MPENKGENAWNFSDKFVTLPPNTGILLQRSHVNNNFLRHTLWQESHVRLNS